MNWQALSLSDATAINKTLLAHKVKAAIDLTKEKSISIFPEALIIYRIDVQPGEKFDRIIKLIKEIKAAIKISREENNFSSEDLSVRFNTDSLLTIEIDTPPGFAIEYTDKYHGEFCAAIGTTYSVNGRETFIFDLNKCHQTLIAAISGHGKSVLLSRIAKGLAASAPISLKLSYFVIDFKNDDLIFTKDLQNTVDYAYTDEHAINIINYIDKEKDYRIEHGWKRRYVLLIDETAQLPKSVDKKLSSIMQVGRSLGINVIAATQHPTAKQIGELVARSFTHRFVGRTENNNSAQWASGTSNSGAETLTKPGSFLYCYGGNVKRLQVFK